MRATSTRGNTTQHPWDHSLSGNCGLRFVQLFLGWLQFNHHTGVTLSKFGLKLVINARKFGLIQFQIQLWFQEGMLIFGFGDITKRLQEVCSSRASSNLVSSVACFCLDFNYVVQLVHRRNKIQRCDWRDPVRPASMEAMGSRSPF